MVLTIEILLEKTYSKNLYISLDSMKDYLDLPKFSLIT